MANLPVEILVPDRVARWIDEADAALTKAMTATDDVMLERKLRVIRRDVREGKVRAAQLTKHARELYEARQKRNGR